MAIKGLTEIIKNIRADANLTTEQVEEELQKALATDWIPKGKFNEQGEEIKMLKKQAEDNAALMKELKASADASDELKKKVDELTASSAKDKEAYEATIAKMRLDSAVEKSLGGVNAKKPSDIVRFLDMTKLKLKDDGSVDGLEDQVAQLKKESAYLFNEDTPSDEEKADTKPKLNFGGGQQDGGKADDFLAQMLSRAGVKNPAN